MEAINELKNKIEEENKLKRFYNKKISDAKYKTEKIREHYGKLCSKREEKSKEYEEELYDLKKYYENYCDFDDLTHKYKLIEFIDEVSDKLGDGLYVEAMNAVKNLKYEND